jgi:hypothetical protein
MKKNVLAFQKLPPKTRPVSEKDARPNAETGVDIWTNSGLSVGFCR